MDRPTVDIVRRMTKEFQQLDGANFRLPVMLDLDSSLCLVGLLQLALRHPDNTGRCARTAQAIIGGVIDSLHEAGFHAAAELAGCGDGEVSDADPS